MSGSSWNFGGGLPGADDHDTVSRCAGLVAIHRGCSSLLWRLVVGSVTIRSSDAWEAVSRSATIRPTAGETGCSAGDGATRRRRRCAAAARPTRPGLKDIADHGGQQSWLGGQIDASSRARWDERLRPRARSAAGGRPIEASASFFKSSGMIILSGPKPASIRSRQIHTDSDSS
jgi:hypothetical protein